MDLPDSAEDEAEQALNDIRQRLRTRCAAMFRPDGSIVVGGSRIFDPAALLRLGQKHLQELGFELAHCMHHPKLAVLGQDLSDYWAFVGLLLRHAQRCDPWIQENNPIETYLLLSESRNSEHAQLPDWRGMLRSAGGRPLSSATWAGFAYLEGLCRRHCSAYVDTSGKVLQEFSVTKRHYDKRGRVNSLGDVLELTAKFATGSTQRSLSAILSAFPASDIYLWRCSALHGSDEQWTATVVVLCLISVLILGAIDVEDARTRLLREEMVDRLARGLEPRL